MRKNGWHPILVYIANVILHRGDHFYSEHDRISQNNSLLIVFCSIGILHCLAIFCAVDKKIGTQNQKVELTENPGGDF